MELQELKEAWGEYDRKLDKSLRLNMQLARKLLFDKARFRMKWLFVMKLAEMVYMVFIVNYLAGFIVKHFWTPEFSIPAFIFEAAIVCYFILDIKMFAIIRRLQFKDNDEAIAPLQRDTERLKLLIAARAKYLLFLIPFYPLVMILIGKIFLNVDFFSSGLRIYLLVNAIVGLCFLPLFIWIFQQMSEKNIKKEWVKNLLAGSGWRLVNDAGEFLDEIKKFEDEAA